MSLISVVFAQIGFWSAVPVSCMSAIRTIRCFTFSQCQKSEYILGKLPVVPVGDTGTIPYSMRQHAEDFVDAAFDTREGAGDGSLWWYVNTWALSWSRERDEK
jgi:hypothetical protein